MPTVRSADPEITACSVSPPPDVPKMSRTRPCFLKMPARCPRRGPSTAHKPSCPTATRSRSLGASCAGAGAADASNATPTIAANALRPFIVRLFLARRDLDELRKALPAQGRVNELELDGVLAGCPPCPSSRRSASLPWDETP